ncbi:MAG: right-handed parallel beta-helix repeat-containing protein, partial [Methanothrix sp.]|nr:right-handed parallel beta-helix repeat-containing protein [Methanothrix sp.]
MKERSNLPSRYILACLLAVFMLALSAQASIISLEHGQSIQKAIDVANPGDIIEILPGTYNENINITKSLILRGISGKDRPILVSRDRGDTVRILANGTRLEGLSLTGATDWSMAAVQVHSQDNIIANNTMHGNAIGIIVSSGNNTIDSNEVDDNYLGGLVIFSAAENNIANNRFISNNQAGVLTINSTNNTIINNNVSENLGIAIKLFQSRDNLVEDNMMITNDYGITLSNADNNYIYNNTAINNDYGIYPYLSRGNEISNNTAFKNDYAIYLWDS